MLSLFLGTNYLLTLCEEIHFPLLGEPVVTDDGWKAFINKKKHAMRPGVEHVCNPSNLETEAAGSL